MTLLQPRIDLVGAIRRSPFGRVQARLAAHQQRLARPPAYIVVCATVAVLNIVGLMMILSASSVKALSAYGSSWYFFDRQFVWALVGAGVFVVASRVDYRRWQRLAPMLLVATAVSLVLVLVPSIGRYVDGSRRWMGAGPFVMQPSELAKLALVLCGAATLARTGIDLDDTRAWRPVLVITAVFGALIMKEPDLDSTIVVALIAFALLVVAGVRAKDLARLAGFGALAATVLAFGAGYRRARMFAFLHPGRDLGNTGYQLRQSLIALGSGGLNGVGLGAGRAKWLFLPNAHTDFIFAIVGEELGFVGCLLVLGLFAGFGLVGMQVARRAPDRFGRLVAAGVTAWIVGQAAINLGAVVGVLPVAGIPLPFLSAGGSSLVITMFGAGILANIARAATPRPQSSSARARRG